MKALPDPGMIGGGRLTRGETRGDRRAPGEATAPRKSILKRLWRYLGRHRMVLVLAALLVVVGNLLSLAGPKLAGMAIDAIGRKAGKVDFSAVSRCAGLMALCYAASAGMAYLLSRMTLRLRRDVIRRMRKDVFDRLLSLPVGFFDSHQTGDIISTISYDIDTVNDSISADLMQLLQSVITVTVSLAMMLSIAPTLVLVFAFTVPASVIYTRWITRKVRPLYRKRSAKLGELNGFMEEMMDGQKTTKAYSREKEVLKRFDVINDGAVEAFTRSEYYGTIVGASVNFINNVSLALVSVFGSLLYLSGGAGLGGIASFVQYSRKFSGPINETANIVGDLQSALAAMERVFRLIDEVPENPDATDARALTDVRGEVQADHVRFGYQRERPILKDFCLRAKPGSLVAIVGPTGAGKTTIINLLMRFYDVDGGSIAVDGNDIRQVTRKSLRLAYSMVLQDSWLFSGTVFDNIAYGKPGATREEVEQAARAAMLHSSICRLPQGYDTVIGGDGVHLSKGQQQLLTIARAMLLDARMLILDEATSSVDTRTELRIQAAMRELMKDKTCFVIAHRLSTIRSADVILVLDEGRVVEQGTHGQLMANRGLYSKLYQAQFVAG